MMTNKELLERYPFLRPLNLWTGKFEEGYEYTYLDDMPQGWVKAFGLQMCEEIREELIRCNYLDQYQVIQVKEKYGFLHWYDDGIPEGCKVHDIVSKYEAISERTCIICGQPATLISKGWISPFCDCVKSTEHYREDWYMPIKEFYKER